MINLIVGGRQKLIEKAVQLCQEEKNVFFYTNYYTFDSVRNRIIELLENPEQNYVYVGFNNKKTVCCNKNKLGTIHLHSNFRIKEENNIIIDSDYVDTIDVIRFKDRNVYLSTLPNSSFPQFLSKNLIDYSVTFCTKPKKEIFTRQEVINLLKPFTDDELDNILHDRK